ncbi:MAG: M48 family metalloprotease [Candidatus Binatia bacterium]
MNFVEQQRRNRRRTLLLIAVFVALLAGSGVALDVALIGAPIPIATITSVVIAGAVALLGWRGGADWVMSRLLAEPLRPREPEHRQLEHIARELAIAAGVPRPRLFVIPDPSPNALAAGVQRDRCAIAVTTGALALLDREETQGVVAHELAHICNRDTAVMTLVSILFGGLLMLADWASRSLAFARPAGRAASPLALLCVPLLILIAPLLSRGLAAAVSRQREYLADARAVELTRNPEGLARALEKIAGSEFPLRAATRSTAHLFIASPLRPRATAEPSAWAALFATHPPLAERIALLRGGHTA